MKSNYDKIVLAGDVGATNCRLSAIGYRRDKPEIIISKTFDSAKITGITQAINTFLKDAYDKHKIEVCDACIGLAGPINQERSFCKLPNTKWSVNAFEILDNTMLGSVAMINDFEAIGFSIDSLDRKRRRDIVQLITSKKKKAEVTSKGIIGVIGPGTGLGKSFLVWDREHNKHRPCASEGGHAAFAPQDEFELDLSQFIKKKKKWKYPVDYEMVASGQGIVNIFEFLMKKKYFAHTAVTKKIMRDKGDKAALISKNSVKDKACKNTMALFVKFTSRCASDFALDIMCKSGIMIAGGIAPKNLDHFKTHFLKEFVKNSTQAPVLKKIPVYIVMNENVGLLGAANVAANFKELGHGK